MDRKTPLALLLTFVASAVSAQTMQIEKADSLFSEFEYAEAIRAYRSADSADAYRRLSRLSTAENMLGLDFLSAEKEDSAEVHFNRAIEAAERVVEQFPDSADSHFDLAAAYGNLALLKGGRTKVRLGRQVEDHALRAVELDSTHADALTVLGVFYREVSKLSWIERLVANSLFGGVPSGSLEKSETYLRRALEADPQSPFAAFELGQTLIERDQPEEARKVYERLLTMEPRNSENVRDMTEARNWLSQNNEE